MTEAGTDRLTYREWLDEVADQLAERGFGPCDRSPDPALAELYFAGESPSAGASQLLLLLPQATDTRSER